MKTLHSILSVIALAACTKPTTIPPIIDACNVCKQTTPPAAVLSSDGLLAARWGELSASVATHATLTNGEPHIRNGAAFELAPALNREGRAHFLASVGVAGGAWGDEQHGGFILDSSLGLKVSVTSDMTLVDVYLLGKEGLMLGFGGLAAGQSAELGNIFGGGVGIRVFRTVAFELTGSAIYALDSPFTSSNAQTTRWIPEGSVSIAFDFCALGTSCDRQAIRQTSTDATCAVYTDAKAICSATMSKGVNARQDLCQRAKSAMALSDDNPVLARDAFTRFLDNLLKSDPKNDALVALSGTDDCLAQWRSCGRQQECLLSQQGQRVQDRRVYAPYVLEALTALGCNADGTLANDCNYICEDPGNKPFACLHPSITR